MSIVGLKLVTGEDIVAESMETLNYYKNPVQVAIVPNRTGQTQAMFVPFPQLAKSSSSREIFLHDSFVICKYDVDLEVENQYNSMFGSGLVVPPKGSFI
jgi:hypothetical protein